MPFSDLHCDTIAWMRQCENRGERMRLRDSERMHVNGEKLRKSGYLLQNFALFVNLTQTPDPWQEVLALADLFDREARENADWLLPVRSAADLARARREEKLAAVLTVEEGGVCLGEREKLRALYARGVRMLTLTWNHPNELGSPNGQLGGLTETGRGFLAEMERLGMVVDVSHLSDQGFWDVCQLAERPFVASHSSCRALWPHRRNLTDEMLRALADRGGLVGVNFYADFLGASETTRTADLVRHLRHVKDVAGLAAVALGSDFDGISCPLELVDAGGMPQLVAALAQDGFTEREIEAITWKNVWDFYDRMLGE